MSKDPAFMFYPADWLVGCSDLTFEERGIYITLICLQHQKGHITGKTIKVSIGCQFSELSQELRSKFITDEDGYIYNTRLESEINKRRNFVEKQRENGAKGGRPKTQTEPNDEPKRNPNETQTKPNDEPTGNPYIFNSNSNYNSNNSNKDNNHIEEEDIVEEEEFENFWDMYNKKVDRAKVKKKFLKLTVNDRKKIFETLPDYIQSTPDKTYRKNPETYINNRSWENELITKDKDNGTKGRFGNTSPDNFIGKGHTEL